MMTRIVIYHDGNIKRALVIGLGLRYEYFTYKMCREWARLTQEEERHLHDMDAD